MKKVMFAGLALAAVLAMGVGQSMAAESAAMKACAAQWDDMKTKGTTPKGMTWKDFEKQCSANPPAAAAPAAPADKGKMAAPTPAAPAAPAAAPKMAAPAAPAAPAAASKMAAPAAAAAPAATGGTAGEHNREKMCSEQYQADKAANKLGGKAWPEYWHECDTKLKAEGK